MTWNAEFTAWQVSRDLKTDGKLGPLSWRAFKDELEELTDAQKALGDCNTKCQALEKRVEALRNMLGDEARRFSIWVVVGAVVLGFLLGWTL